MYLMIHKRTEWDDEVWSNMFQGLGMWDVSKEVLVYKFFLGAPDLFPSFVDDHIEVRMVPSFISTWWYCEEVGEEVKVDDIGFINSRRRLYGGSSDGGWALNNIFG